MLISSHDKANLFVNSKVGGEASRNYTFPTYSSKPLDVAQSGGSTPLGTERPQVRILPSRLKKSEDYDFSFTAIIR